MQKVMILRNEKEANVKLQRIGKSMSRNLQKLRKKGKKQKEKKAYFQMEARKRPASGS